MKAHDSGWKVQSAKPGKVNHANDILYYCLFITVLFSAQGRNYIEYRNFSTNTKLITVDSGHLCLSPLCLSVPFLSACFNVDFYELYVPP
jgi:hypothetical protein